MLFRSLHRLINGNAIHGDFIDGTAILYKKINKRFKKGLLFENGTEKLFPHCDFDSFCNGFAVFWDWSKTEFERMSYINRKGELLFEPRNIIAHDFSEERAFIYDMDENITVLIDANGNVVKKFDDIYESGVFNEGVCRVIQSDETLVEKIAFVNRDGEFVIPFDYEYDYNENHYYGFGRRDCCEGLIMLPKGNKVGFVSKENEVVIPFVYDGASHFHNGYAYAKKGKMFGVIDRENNIVIPFEYEDFVQGNGEVFALKKDGIWSAVDYNGSIVLQFEDISSIKDNILTVLKGERWGGIDVNGKVIIPFEYEMLIFIRDSFQFSVSDARGFGLMDVQCNVLVPPNQKSIRTMSEGIWIASDDLEHLTIYNRNGETLRLDLQEFAEIGQRFR